MAYHLSCFPGKTNTNTESAFKANRQGPCSGKCGRMIEVGQPIAWFRRGQAPQFPAIVPSSPVAAPPAAPSAPTVVPQAPPVAAPSSDLGAALGALVSAVRSAIMPEVLAEIEASLSTIPAPVAACTHTSTVTTIHVVDPSQGPAIPVDLGVQHEKFPALLQACSARDAKGARLNVWIAGPAASGKTTAAESTAKALDLPYYHTGAISDPIELLGFVDAGGTYRGTLFRQAYENGGVFLFDEIDASEPRALVAFNAFLANGIAAFPDGMVRRHPDCVIIAAANTWGHGATHEYVGRLKQDAALMDRFIRLSWGYDAALETAFAPNAEVCKVVQAIRAAVLSKGLRVLVTPRATVRVSALVAVGMSLSDALDSCVYDGMGVDAAKTIRSMVSTAGVMIAA